MLLTNDAADLEDLLKFIETDVNSVLRRGPNTRLMILSRCPGDRDGNDGMHKLEHLGNRGRDFYEVKMKMKIQVLDIAWYHNKTDTAKSNPPARSTTKFIPKTPPKLNSREG